MKQICAFFLLASFVVACSSAPPVNELAINSDPNQEINRIDAALKDASGMQVEVLSPTNYESARKYLLQAVTDRDKNKDAQVVLHDLSVSQAYLDKANEAAKVSTEVLHGVTAERQNAIKADAPKYFPAEFAAADNELKSVTKRVEDNKTDAAEKSRGSLSARYNDLELQAIRKMKLGEARVNEGQAIKEGAKKMSPETLAWAQKKINDDDGIIISDRHNQEAVERASQDAKAASERLLKIVRMAKNSKNETPEQRATRLEAEQNAKAATEQKLNESQSELQTKEGDVRALASENDKLQAMNALEKKYEFAKKQFSPKEAEVYKQGDKLVLRLKGLSFPKDQAVITVDNYPLLTKVQSVIKAASPEHIVVEGHTDSTGSKAINTKLSNERAEAVESYLKANNFIKDEQITAKGYGYSKPIATNKTRVGRAQNRRVDIIISATSPESQTTEKEQTDENQATQ